MNNIKTYRDLLAQLQTLTDEQLDCNLSCELVHSQECFSSVDNDFGFDIAGENNDYLDNNHPVFVLQF